MPAAVVTGNSSGGAKVGSSKGLPEPRGYRGSTGCYVVVVSG